MTIRRATYDDLPAVVELGKTAIVGDDRHLIGFDSLHWILTQYMSMPGVWFAVDEREGAISAAMVGVVSPYPWNPDETLAYAVLWWSRTKGLGGALFREFKEWAKLHGAAYIMAASRNERTSQIYEGHNMRVLETNYIGVL